MRVFQIILGFFLLGISLFPFKLSNLYENRMLNLSSAEYIPPFIWILGSFTLAALAWIAALLLRSQTSSFNQNFEKYLSLLSHKHLLILIAFSVTLVAYYCFNLRPHLIDSIAQLFQAKIFASGNVTAPIHELKEFFLIQNMLFQETLWSSQYPPGHALFLTVGELLDTHLLLKLLLASGTAFFIYYAVKIFFDKNTAKVSLALLIICPLFLSMQASYMNHASCMFSLSAALAAAAKYRKSEQKIYLSMLAFALGLALITRPYTTVALTLVFTPYLLKHCFKPSPLIFGTVPILFGLIYNYFSTGNAFTSGYIKNWGASHGLGFHESPWGIQFTFFDGIANQILNLLYANLYIFENVWPALLPLGVWLICKKKIHQYERLCLLALTSLVCAHIFYWHTDFYLGPRFLYSGLIFFIPLFARVLLDARKFFASKGELLKVNSLSWFYFTCLLSLIYLFTYGLPHRLSIYAKSNPSLKIDLEKKLYAHSIDDGLILVKVNWPNRLISELRGLNVSASLAEEAFLKSDLCQLHEFVQRHRLKSNFSNLLEKFIDQSPQVKKLKTELDYAIRVAEPINVTPSCTQELRYDQSAYTVYTPHVLLNEWDLRGDIVVARDLRDSNHKLVKAYPNKDVFIFDGNTFTEISSSALQAILDRSRSKTL